MASGDFLRFDSSAAIKSKSTTKEAVTMTAVEVSECRLTVDQQPKNDRIQASDAGLISGSVFGGEAGLGFADGRA
jgi:hypothetical protein